MSDPEQARDTGGLREDERAALSKMRTDLDRFDAYRREDVRVLLDIIDRLSQGAAHEERGLDVERVHRIVCKRLVEHEPGGGPYLWPCTAFIAEYRALATPEAAPDAD